MNVSSLLLSLLLVVVASTIFLSSAFSSAQNPEAPLCVIPSMANPTQSVNLTNIRSATYNGQLATTMGLKGIQIVLGWCKPLNTSTKCQNQTQPWSMMILDGSNGQCLQGFTSVVTPGAALSNTSYSITEWAPYTGSQATVEITCDTSVPSGTASLVGVVTNEPSYMYSLQFNSSDACLNASSSYMEFFGGLKH